MNEVLILKNFKTTILIIALSIASSGCGTLMFRSNPTSRSSYGDPFYRGTITSGGAAFASVTVWDTKAGCHSIDFNPIARIGILAVSLVSLPADFLIDTLLFPVDLGFYFNENSRLNAILQNEYRLKEDLVARGGYHGGEIEYVYLALHDENDSSKHSSYRFAKKIPQGSEFIIIKVIKPKSQVHLSYVIQFSKADIISKYEVRIPRFLINYTDKDSHPELQHQYFELLSKQENNEDE